MTDVNEALSVRKIDPSTVDLSLYNNGNFFPGSRIKRAVWYIVNMIFFASFFPFPSFLKRWLLRLFGGDVEKCVIKPRVNIKYPWYLVVGRNTWIGENVWIDNLAIVKIGNNVCVSQGVMLLTGNHDYSKRTFDLMVGGITMEDGAWIGACSVVCPGSYLHTHCVLYAGTVFGGVAEPYTVYRGNPAVLVRKRVVRDDCFEGSE